MFEVDENAIEKYVRLKYICDWILKYYVVCFKWYICHGFWYTVNLWVFSTNHLLQGYAYNSCHYAWLIWQAYEDPGSQFLSSQQSFARWRESKWGRQRCSYNYAFIHFKHNLSVTSYNIYWPYKSEFIEMSMKNQDLNQCSFCGRGPTMMIAY